MTKMINSTEGDPTLPFDDGAVNGEADGGMGPVHPDDIRALDDLFVNTLQYRRSKDYAALLKFISRFRFYSPYNAMLAHLQLPGATFVAPASRWRTEYQRRIKPGARPLILLQPGGPIMTVFDVSDTEPQDGVSELPLEVVHPFDIRFGNVAKLFAYVCNNARRDGIDVAEQKAGSQSAGMIREAEPGRKLKFESGSRASRLETWVPVRYEILTNSQHSLQTKYATVAHELAHLYCGHLGTPNRQWWPDRQRLKHEQMEFEAESVSFLACARAGIENPSERYLADLMESDSEVPIISLECVLKAVGLIEQMGQGPMKMRKEHDGKRSKMGSIR